MLQCILQGLSVSDDIKVYMIMLYCSVPDNVSVSDNATVYLTMLQCIWQGYSVSDNVTDYSVSGSVIIAQFPWFSLFYYFWFCMNRIYSTFSGI